MSAARNCLDVCDSKHHNFSTVDYIIPPQVAGEQQHILISKFNLRPAAAGTTTRPAPTTPRNYLVPPPNQYEVSRFPLSASAGRKQVPFYSAVPTNTLRE